MLKVQYNRSARLKNKDICYINAVYFGLMGSMLLAEKQLSDASRYSKESENPCNTLQTDNSQKKENTRNHLL